MIQTYTPIRGMIVCSNGSGDYVLKADVQLAIAKAAGKIAADLAGIKRKPDDPRLGPLVDAILAHMRPEFFTD